MEKLSCKCITIEGNTVDRASMKNGKGWCENVSPTLNTQDRHAVVFAIEGNGARPSHLGDGYSTDGAMYTLNTIEKHAVCYTVDCRNNEINKEISCTLQAHNNGGWSVNCTNPVMYEKQDSEKMKVVLIDQNQTDARYTMNNDGICQTVTARWGTGGGSRSDGDSD